jgi:hypothetical protein
MRGHNEDGSRDMKHYLEPLRFVKVVGIIFGGIVVISYAAVLHADTMVRQPSVWQDIVWSVAEIWMAVTLLIFVTEQIGTIDQVKDMYGAFIRWRKNKKEVKSE